MDYEEVGNPTNNMAAPLMAMEYARISLEFSDKNIEDSWFLLVYSEMPTISEVVEEIVKRHKIGFNITLHLKEKWLPPWEKSIIIKDEDSITVKLDKCKHFQDKDVCDDDITECIKKRKRKHRELSVDHSSDATQTGSTDIPVSHSKKKKKKKENSPVHEDTSILLHIPTDSLDADTNGQVSDKTSKSVSEVITNIQTECTMNTSSVSTVAINSTDVANVRPDMADTENNTKAVSQTSENVEEEILPKKRKRIRKHRRRKNQSEDTTMSSFDASQIQTKEGQGKYKGRAIGKEELFFGSIPDKLVSPKYYRHGYRNLNVYQPEPNKHKVFKSDSENEHEVQEETEQYNFLSSTRIIEEREQYRQEEGENYPVDSGPANISLSRINDLSNDRNSLDSPTIVDTRETQTGAQIVQTDIENTDNFTSTHLDGSISNTGETERSRQSKDDSTKERNKSVMDIDSAVSEADKYVTKTNTGVTRNNIENLGRAGPSVLSRQTLPNGVSVFVRQRRNNRTAVREMSKEEQLNTSCSNVSTIFKVPLSSSPSLRKQNGQLGHENQSLLSSPSSRKQNGQQGNEEQSQNISCNQVFTHNASAECSRATPQQQQQAGHKMSLKQTDVTPSQAMADQEQCQDITINGTSPKGVQCKDYTQFSQLTGPPVLGMVIAYKLLEISLSCCPEVSAYKEGEVLGVDKNGMVALKNILPQKAAQYNKFHVEVEDKDGILTNTGKQPDKVILHVSSLLETRVIQRL